MKTFMGEIRKTLSEISVLSERFSYKESPHRRSGSKNVNGFLDLNGITGYDFFKMQNPSYVLGVFFVCLFFNKNTIVCKRI